MLTLKEGEFLIKIARKAIQTYLEEGKTVKPPAETPEALKEKAGVFVTLRTHPEKNLRGCIGYPEPTKKLIQATIESAINSATEDPRFIPLPYKELDKVTIEVTVLTPPEKIVVEELKEYPKKIALGKHGLLMRQGPFSGLLLPQVPIEQNWDEEEFLSHTCLKAGLPPDCWLNRETEIYRFSGQIFTEKKPAGEIMEEKIVKE